MERKKEIEKFGRCFFFSFSSSFNLHVIYASFVMTVLYGVILLSDFFLRSMVAIYLLRHSNLNHTSFLYFFLLRSLSVSFSLRCLQCGVIVYFSVFSLLFIDFHPSISGRIR